MLKKFLAILAILQINFTAFSSPECLDNSKHTYTYDGYDYKNYYNVCCTCPCERYPYLFDRCQCTKCGHFRAPK